MPCEYIGTCQHCTGWCNSNNIIYGCEYYSKRKIAELQGRLEDERHTADVYVSKTIRMLKRKGFLRETDMNTYQRTEQILKDYREFEKCSRKELLGKIDVELNKLKCEEKYYDLIPKMYFEKKTIEQMAEYFDVSTSTIRRQRVRLIRRLRTALFAEDFLAELFVG